MHPLLCCFSPPLTASRLSLPLATRYVAATLKLITLSTAGGRAATTLLLGKCSLQNYNEYNGRLWGVSWFGTKGTRGALECGCNFEGSGPDAWMPPCKDGPDGIGWKLLLPVRTKHRMSRLHPAPTRAAAPETHDWRAR